MLRCLPVAFGALSLAPAFAARGDLVIHSFPVGSCINRGTTSMTSLPIGFAFQAGDVLIAGFNQPTDICIEEMGIVRLQPNSAVVFLTAPYDPNRPKFDLMLTSGALLSDVTFGGANTGRKWIVKTQLLGSGAIGTSFAVVDRISSNRVHVRTGSVEVTTATTSPIVVTADQWLSFNQAGTGSPSNAQTVEHTYIKTELASIASVCPATLGPKSQYNRPKPKPHHHHKRKVKPRRWNRR